MDAQRIFITGDKWLYFKIYMGPKTCDRALSEIIDPCSQELLDSGVIEKWFFIRYQDPKYHLRLRYLVTEDQDVGKVILKLFPLLNRLVNQDLIESVQLDTYKRELERYGSNTIEASESLFFHDSRMVASFVKLLGDQGNSDIRWLFGLKAIDAHLDSFQYEESAKLVLLERLKTNFGEEHGMSRPLKKQLDEKYRTHRSAIDTFLNEFHNQPMAYQKLIQRKMDDTAKICQHLIGVRDSGDLQVHFDALMGSYIHMIMNRIFRSKNRIYEMVCYDFLYRYYRSKIARQKYTSV